MTETVACRNFQAGLVAWLDEGDDARTLPRDLKSHARECARCAALAADITSLWHALPESEAAPPVPSDAAPVNSGWAGVPPAGSHEAPRGGSGRWAMPAAAALALLVSGFAIGAFVFRDTTDMRLASEVAALRQGVYVATLADPDASVRLGAVDALSEIGTLDAEATDALARIALSDPVIGLRLAVIDLLSRMPSAQVSLHAIAEADVPTVVRLAAIDVLLRSNETEAREMLRRLEATDVTPEIRRYARDALEES